MDDITFSWDERKNRANQKKHGISFDEAKTVFSDENARIIADPDHSEDEDRYILLGLSAKLRVLVISHACYEGDEIIRIISARKADRTEHSQYRDYRNER